MGENILSIDLAKIKNSSSLMIRKRCDGVFEFIDYSKPTENGAYGVIADEDATEFITTLKGKFDWVDNV